MHAVRGVRFLIHAIDSIDDLVQPRVDHVFGKVKVGVSANTGVAVWKQRLRHPDHAPDIGIQRGFAMPLEVDHPDAHSCPVKVLEDLLENFWR